MAARAAIAGSGKGKNGQKTGAEARHGWDRFWEYFSLRMQARFPCCTWPTQPSCAMQQEGNGQWWAGGSWKKAICFFHSKTSPYKSYQDNPPYSTMYCRPAKRRRDTRLKVQLFRCCILHYNSWSNLQGGLNPEDQHVAVPKAQMGWGKQTWEMNQDEGVIPAGSPTPCSF